MCVTTNIVNIKNSDDDDDDDKDATHIKKTHNNQPKRGACRSNDVK